MKVAVIGSRSFCDYLLLQETLDALVGQTGPFQVVSGGACAAEEYALPVQKRTRSADALAERWAFERRMPQPLIIRPRWRVNGIYNPRAGFERNSLIIDAAERVVAFWDHQSRGTLDSLQKARERGITVQVVLFTPAAPPGKGAQHALF